MSHDFNPKGKSISREEMENKHQKQEWADNSGQWNEFSRRALSGLQYHPAGKPLDETFRRLEQQIAVRSNARRVLSLRQKLGLAAGAAILILAAYFVYFQQPPYEKIYARHFEYLPSAMLEDSGLRRAEGQSGGLRAAAAQAYETGQYQEAEALARAWLEEAPNDQEMRFYYGLLLLGKGDASGSIPHLAAVKQRPGSPAYERPAAWYLGLAYLKRGQIDTAKRLFSELKSGQDRYAIQARSVLKKL